MDYYSKVFQRNTNISSLLFSTFALPITYLYVTSFFYLGYVSQPRLTQSRETTEQEKIIKGNINSKRHKIYHIPSGQFYDRTHATEWFSSEEEAQEAGYRKSKR